MHDPDQYHDPDSFVPERFMGMNGQASEKDPRGLVFGFGRRSANCRICYTSRIEIHAVNRICPGQDIANATLFITMAMIIAVLDISKHVENGVVVEPEVNYCPGVVR